MGAIGHELISISATTAEVGLAESELEALAEANAMRAMDQAADDYRRDNPDLGHLMPEVAYAHKLSDPAMIRAKLRTLLPRRKISVRAFAIDRTRVTNHQYLAFMRATGRAAPPLWPDGQLPPGGEDWAVTNVSHKDAFSYATWAELELPSEDEWAVAAGAAEGRRYPWGDQLLPVLETLREQLAGGFVATAHPELAGPHGVLGLISNHWEWCYGAFDVVPGGDAAAFHALYPNHDSSWRALRGGHTYAFQWGNHVRIGNQPSNNLQPYGFRCVRR